MEMKETKPHTGAVLDTLTQMEQEKERIKKTFERKRKISYHPGKDLAAITNAVKSGQVRMISGRLRSEAARIKKSGADSKEIARAVAKIKKLLEKADIKMRKLIVEERIEGERQQAEKQKEIEREKELAKELCLKRKKRKQKEENDMMECAKGRGVNFVSDAEIEMEMKITDSSFQAETAIEASIAGENISYSETDVSSQEAASVDITL